MSSDYSYEEEWKGSSSSSSQKPCYRARKISTKYLTVCQPISARKGIQVGQTLTAPPNNWLQAFHSITIPYTFTIVNTATAIQGTVHFLFINGYRSFIWTTTGNVFFAFPANTVTTITATPNSTTLLPPFPDIPTLRGGFNPLQRGLISEPITVQQSVLQTGVFTVIVSVLALPAAVNFTPIPFYDIGS